MSGTRETKESFDTPSLDISQSFDQRIKVNGLGSVKVVFIAEGGGRLLGSERLVKAVH